MKINQIFLKPILSEKSTNLVKDNFYMFEVDKKSVKTQVKQAIEKLYPVKVARIRLSNRKGKVKKTGRKMLSKKMSDRKIVFVKLKTGKIDLFPQA